MLTSAGLQRVQVNATNIPRLPRFQPRLRLHLPGRTYQTSRYKSNKKNKNKQNKASAATSTPTSSSFRSATVSPDLLELSTHPYRYTNSKQARLHWLLAYRKQGIEVPSIESLVDVPGAHRQKIMLWYSQVVSVPTADTPGASVLLHFDSRRYIFGEIAEGTQRSFTQRRVGISKLDELFLSGPVTWKSVGGLLGMILTIADVVGHQQKAGPVEQNKKNKKKNTAENSSAINSLKIHAAENINHMIATARKFIFRKGVPLRMHEVRHSSRPAHTQGRKPDFEDANLRVWYVSLLPDDQAEPHGRKRSHDDMVAEDNASTPSQTAEQKEADRALVKSVVNNMFDSNWQFDALVETTLHQVKLPAAIFVKGDDGQIKKYDGPMPGGAEPVPDIPVLTRTPWPATNVSVLPRTSPSRQSLCYIAKGHPRRGKFNAEEAKRLGVDKRDNKLLAAGQTAKGKDGMDVTPEMVVGATVEGRGMVFVDLPDTSYVSSFLAQPEWTDGSIMDDVEIMYWNLGRDVVHDERIQAFMKQREGKRHVVFSPDVSPNSTPLVSSANVMTFMHMIDPDRFSLPVFDSKPRDLGAKPYEVGHLGHKLQMSPRVEVQEDETAPPSSPNSEYLPPKVAELATEARQKASDQAFLKEIQDTESELERYRDVEVIPLGTGSALPSKYRNVSATLVRVPGYGSYLFDCGENTLGQLRRMYGFEKADAILSDLKVIWISHLHADHHLGTASVIRAWRDATASAQEGTLPRLTVASRSHLIDWLREYADVEDFGFDRVQLVNINGPPQPDGLQNPVIFTSSESQAVGLTRIDAVRVDHCNGALACVFTWPHGLRVAYSGDCRPSRAFAELGADCTLLLHEATLDDVLKGDAIAKKHCTMREALDVARRMRARRVLLTHFSQRYPKIANELSKDAGHGVKDQVILMAFDQMHVKLGDFKKAELFMPALRELLGSAGDED